MIQLDNFTTAYIECALWASSDDHDEPIDRNYSVSDLAPETLAIILEDCQDFQQSFGDLISSDLTRAGHDFFLTRNSHGSGFWDGDWEFPVPGITHDAGAYLTSMCKPYGSFEPYVGDDGLIYS